MTPAEQNLHDIVNSFARLPRVVREVCPTCGGSGKCATSSWERPQMHVERCATCAGTGAMSREVTP